MLLSSKTVPPDVILKDEFWCKNSILGQHWFQSQTPTAEFSGKMVAANGLP